MKIENKIVFEFKKDERIYQFVCENASPLGEVYDVVNELKNYVTQRISDSERKEVEQESEKIEAI